MSDTPLKTETAAKNSELPPLRERVQHVIDELINPAVAMHGGVISLVDVKDDTAYVTMGGGCQGCAMSKMTLKAGIESMLMEEIPEIHSVVDVTDHAGGANPYFSPDQ